MSHLLGVPTGRISLLPKPLENGRLQLGFVETGRTDIFRDALIGMAPLIAGGIVVTLTGMPTTLVVGNSISLGFSYTAPATDGARIEVTSAVATTSNDVVPANNSAQASTDFALNPPVAPSIPVPVMPWPAYVLMLVLLAGVVRLRTRQIHH